MILHLTVNMDLREFFWQFAPTYYGDPAPELVTRAVLTG